MDIPAHLWVSRHGVYYFRQTSRVAGKQTSKRVSLHTKDPKIAKSIAIKLLAGLASTMSQDPKTFEVSITSAGISVKTDPTDPTDAEKLGEFMRNNRELITMLAQQATPAVQSNPFEKVRQEREIAESLLKEETGTNIDVVLDKYEKRKSPQLAPKTLYGYIQYIKIFCDWYKKQYSKKTIIISSIDRKVIAAYIEHLQSEGVLNATIEKNYLRALNGLFEFAKTTGDYPDVAVPSKMHKLTTKKEIEKNRKERNPFSNEDLALIFKPENLAMAKHPEQFWVPILALFTGARLGELCQLSVKDIGEVDGIPTISITDDGDGEKRLKSLASKRILPLHPIIIECGFLEYVEDIKKFNGQVFPDLFPDVHGYYSKEPSRRWGTYLDKIGITDPSKVFHSFRSTANNRLKQNGISEEIRCEFVGHDHDTVNSKHYTEKYSVKFLHDTVLPALAFDADFSGLKYKKQQFTAFITKELARIERKNSNKSIRMMKDYLKRNR